MPGSGQELPVATPGRWLVRRSFAEVPEYRALLLGLLLVLGVLLWPAESSRDAEAPESTASVRIEDEARGTWPAAQAAEPLPVSAPDQEKTLVGED
jgi:hypothetical protein